ncbi:6874b1f8-1e6f-4b78-8e44-b32f7ed6bc2d [Thermothielavioides terrestris]|uniref:6874b1f8-1e6f-4b78-8e44-b32f7ed6bc2d n=1 Tax=Thermothielavioides terrestris TaxID=2587410 RepID=A0A3S4D702_9PEZI|nr:6874b1f8-1e6f-4b78-8e44-b32f7ed6bc2d [Thermothielavioides terrestris]
MSAIASRTAMLSRRLAPSTLSRAAFTTSARHPKSAVDAATETLKSVDRKVSDKIVDGINIGTAYANKMKEATHEGKASEMKGKAHEAAGEAKGKASEMKGKASEVASEAKGKAGEVAGKTREAVGEAKEKLS